MLKGYVIMKRELKSKRGEKKVTKEKFCMCCKSKDNLQASINLLTDPAYLCSKCISTPYRKKKK